jgi:hypothetical protein
MCHEIMTDLIRQVPGMRQRKLVFEIMEAHHAGATTGLAAANLQHGGKEPGS